MSEKSCYTCRWSKGSACGRHSLTEDMDIAIDEYAVKSGCVKNGGGMPVDRTVVCPGHESREQPVGSFEKYKADQARARSLGLDYAKISSIVMDVRGEETSVGRAVELIREMALAAVDKALEAHAPTPGERHHAYDAVDRLAVALMRSQQELDAMRLELMSVRAERDAVSNAAASAESDSLRIISAQRSKLSELRDNLLGAQVELLVERANVAREREAAANMFRLFGLSLPARAVENGEHISLLEKTRSK